MHQGCGLNCGVGIGAIESQAQCLDNRIARRVVQQCLASVSRSKWKFCAQRMCDIDRLGTEVDEGAWACHATHCEMSVSKVLAHYERQSLLATGVVLVGGGTGTAALLLHVTAPAHDLPVLPTAFEPSGRSTVSPCHHDTVMLTPGTPITVLMVIVVSLRDKP